MKVVAAVLVLFCLSPCLALAQSDKAPKPGPAVLKLGYYAGNWRGIGHTHGGPFGAAGKLSSKISCSWFDGHFNLVCRGEETGPSGTRHFLEIKGYDPQAKAYTAYSISSRGESETDTGGTLADGKLTFLSHAGGARIRYSEEHLSPDAYTYRAEASIGGKPWTTIAEGKITRVSARLRARKKVQDSRGVAETRSRRECQRRRVLDRP